MRYILQRWSCMMLQTRDMTKSYSDTQDICLLSYTFDFLVLNFNFWFPNSKFISATPLDWFDVIIDIMTTSSILILLPVLSQQILYHPSCICSFLRVTCNYIFASGYFVFVFSVSLCSVFHYILINEEGKSHRAVYTKK